MAEATRGGLETIPEVQRESAYVLGFEQMADIKPRGHSTGHQHLHSRRRGQCDLPHQGIVRGVRHRAADVMYMAKDLIGMYYVTPMSRCSC